jgi:probable DNA repair protein
MRLACSGLRGYFARNATVVVPTPVLASAAAEDLARFQMEDGCDSWQRSPIHSIETWLERCWHEVRYDTSGAATLLSPSQELLLWRQLVEEEHADLFDVNAAARGARDAARLIAQWQIAVDPPAWSEHQDGCQFLVWHRRFEEICREKGWMTRTHLWRQVPEWFAQGSLAKREVVLLGFQDWPPALRAVRDAAGASALPWNVLSQQRPPSAKASYSNLAEELEAAARWTRAAWERQPGLSLGVFLPELDEHRTVVERAFRDVLYPSSALHGGVAPEDCIFHIDSAGPLHSQPLIASALLLLQLASARIDSSQAGAILRNPFLRGAVAERDLRAYADLDLRRRRELDVSLSDLEYASRNCPLLVTAWRLVRRVLEDQSAQADLASWSHFIGDLLKAFGWLGDIDLSATEQSVFDSWQSALSNLGALGMVAGPVRFEVAFAHLRRLLSAAGPKTGSWSSPIQILDSTDAAGLAFDEAFLVGLSEETWPPRERLSPFIPLALQRAYSIPGSSADTVRELATRRTRALFQSAPVVSASFSGRLAPIAAAYFKKSSPVPELWEGMLPVAAYGPASLECVEDSVGPAYRLSEPIRGGAAVLRSQSACAFRAFAEFRLNAQSPEDACFGLDASARGRLLHKALEAVWCEIGSQDKLRSFDEEGLTALVRRVVEREVSPREWQSEFQQQNNAAERDRLTQLVLEWLEIERGRKQPFTIQTVEQQRPCEVAGLQLNLRIDRIDQLENGKLVLIDYKSGLQDKKKLDGQRPPEPQLLLYASAMGEEVEGVFFAQLKPRELSPIGYSRHEQFSSKKVEVLGEGWAERMTEWRETVDRLARDFAQGYAHIYPASDACTFCQNRPLCRIQERSGDDDA